MTAVDHAELKRVAEGATPGPWSDGPPAWFRGRRSEEDGKRPIQRPGHPGTMANVYGKENAAFIAAANPAAVLALLSEIEGLKAERDGLRAGINTLELERKRPGVRLVHLQRAVAVVAGAALRTQAPDSWRPIAEHDNSADEVLVMAEGWTKPIVAWRHHPSSRTDMWLTVPGKYQVKPTEFCPLPALRPQTAESGK